MYDLLEKFKVVVQEGSITKAAKVLHISQPAVSIAIQTLEAEIGTALLIRSKKRLILTKPGKLVFDKAMEVSSSIKSLRSNIKDYTRAKENELKIGMIDNVAIYACQNVLTQNKFLKNVKIDIRVHNTSKLIELVDNNTIDIAIISKSTNTLSKQIKHESFNAEDFNIVYSPRHVNIANAEDLYNIPYISYNKESNTFFSITKQCKEFGLELQPAICSTSPEVIIQMVLQGIGFSILPENLIRNYLMKNTLKVFKNRNYKIKRDLLLIYRRDTYLSTLTKEFILELKKSYA